MSILPTRTGHLSRALTAGITALSVLALTACGSGNAGDAGADAHAHGDMRSITDVMGREVQVPEHVDRIMLGEQRLLYTTALLNPDDPAHGVVAWPDDLEKNSSGTYQRYVEKFPEIADIPTTGDVYDGSMSLEQALDARPDVFIVGEAKFDAAQEAGIVDGLAQAGVPTVVVDYFTDPMNDTVPSIDVMGLLLGREQQAQDFISFYESKVNPVLDRLKDSTVEPTRTFIWRSPGYNECCSTFSHANLGEVIDAVGGKNIGDDMIDTDTGQVSPEALVDQDPDVIIATGTDWATDKTPVHKGGYIPLGYDLSHEDAAADLQKVVDEQPGIKELGAVKDKRTFAAWHHFYDSPYNFLAIEWFAQAMHPDLFADLDPEADWREMHEKFLPLEATGTFWTPLP